MVSFCCKAFWGILPSQQHYSRYGNVSQSTISVLTEVFQQYGIIMKFWTDINFDDALTVTQVTPPGQWWIFFFFFSATRVPLRLDSRTKMFVEFFSLWANSCKTNKQTKLTTMEMADKAQVFAGLGECLGPRWLYLSFLSRNRCRQWRTQIQAVSLKWVSWVTGLNLISCSLVSKGATSGGSSLPPGTTATEKEAQNFKSSNKQAQEVETFNQHECLGSKSRARRIARSDISIYGITGKTEQIQLIFTVFGLSLSIRDMVTQKHFKCSALSVAGQSWRKRKRDHVLVC